MLETSVRLLRLLSLLSAGRDWSGAELAARLEVTARTVRNDVERLRIMGYSVDSSTGTGGGYRLGSGSALPPLLLDDEEAIAVVVGLRAAAGGTVTGIEETSLRALAKLERTLPSRLRPRVDALREATVSATRAGPTVDAEVLTEIAAAIRRTERLRFSYTGRDGTTATREVEPYRLVYTGRRWYLLAWDVAKDDWRTFRADRVKPLVPGGPRFTPRELPDGDGVNRVLRGVGSLAWRHQARILMKAPAATVADIITPAGGMITPVDERSCRLETGADSLHDLAAYLGALNIDFTVEDPPEFRELLRALAERYAAAAGSYPGPRIGESGEEPR